MVSFGGGGDEVRIKITADDQTQRGVRSAKREVGTLDSAIQGLKPSWLAVGAAAAAGSAALIAGARAAIGAASDLAENQSRVNVVFGQSAGVINEWAGTAVTAMGLARQEALGAAGEFGNLFTSMGLGQGEAAGLSTNVVQLGADFASFNNLAGGTNEALTKLRAGLVGEAEPLRSLGININAAAVEAKALELGLAATKAEITDAAKVQARYALIVEQSGNAQGDFARTSDGLANQQRILDANMKQLSATIGTFLIPTALAATEQANKLFLELEGLKDLPEIRVTVHLIEKFTKAEIPGTGQGVVEWLFNNSPAGRIQQQIDAAREGIGDIRGAVGGALDPNIRWSGPPEPTEQQLQRIWDAVFGGETLTRFGPGGTLGATGGGIEPGEILAFVENVEIANRVLDELGLNTHITTDNLEDAFEALREELDATGTSTSELEDAMAKAQEELEKTIEAERKLAEERNRINAQNQTSLVNAAYQAAQNGVLLDPAYIDYINNVAKTGAVGMAPQMQTSTVITPNVAVYVGDQQITDLVVTAIDDGESQGRLTTVGTR